MVVKWNKKSSLALLLVFLLSFQGLAPLLANEQEDEALFSEASLEASEVLSSAAEESEGAPFLEKTEEGIEGENFEPSLAESKHQ